MLQLEFALTGFPRATTLPRWGGLRWDHIGMATAVTYYAREETVDEELETWQTGAHGPDVTLDSRPDGSAVVVICDYVKRYA